MYIPYFVTCSLVIPIVGLLFVLTATNTQNIKNVTLSSTCFTLIFACFVLYQCINFCSDDVFFQEQYVSPFASMFYYNIAFDKVSIWFVLIISFICFLIMLWSLHKPITKPKTFGASLLLFEAMAIGAAISQNLFLLIFFIEGSIIPLIIMICALWQAQNREMLYQFVVYSALSATLAIVACIAIYLKTHTANLQEISNFKGIMETWCFVVLLAGIAVKIPLFPIHFWLPKVHTDAPTECSILLASIVLKFSSLLILKILLPLFDFELYEYKTLISILCSITISIACSSIIFETDLKKIFANVSIIHMNMYFMIVLYSVNSYIYCVLYHSALMCMLFFVVDILQGVCKGRSITSLKNAMLYSVKDKTFVILAIFIAIGAPFTWGFCTDIIAIKELLNISYIIVCISIFAIVIYTTYFFYLYTNTIKKIQIIHSGYVKHDLETKTTQKIAIATLIFTIISATAFAPILF